MKKKFLGIGVAVMLIVAIVCAVAILPLNRLSGTAYAATAYSDIEKVAQGIIDWKKSDVGSAKNEYLINDAFLRYAGTTPGDWYPIGLGRLGVEDNQSGYLATIADAVSKRYATENKLDKAKATEWHRISLAILACGGNPRKAGNDGNIDLIADGTYDRTDSDGNGILGKQGINGFIWGLITLDSMYYAVPSHAHYTRDDIILNILNRELDGGGWALGGNVADPDITAMAIQALAPYYNSEKEYSYINKNISETAQTSKVREAVDRALEKLSELQQADGGYVSWGSANSESAVQIAVALCSLGRSIFDDADFVCDGKTLWDGIIKYRNSDGGFLHSFEYDADNPTSLPDKSNTMASEQALYGMAAIMRLMKGQRRLYDFRPEQGEEVKSQISAIKAKIDAVSPTASRAEIAQLYEEYLGIDASERSYVYNYKKLSMLLASADIPYAEEKIEYNSGDAGVIEPMQEFTQADRDRTDALSLKLNMSYKTQVLTLYAKIKHSFDFDGKQRYVAKLEKAKNEIDTLSDEIDAIKIEIKQKLYPFDKISLKDKKTVYSLYDRYIALDEYDRSLLEQSDIEGLMKCKTQVDNLELALILSLTLGTVAVALAIGVGVGIKKRKKAKLAKEMPESEE